MKPYPHQPRYKPKEGLVDPKADPVADAHRSELRSKIHELLQRLSEQQRQVITLRFGLEDGNPRTLREVGQLQGCTPENVRRYETNALRKLSLPINREKLIPFVIEPGSSEIMENLQVDLSFVGLSPELERDWRALVWRGEPFKYLFPPYSDFDLMRVASLPLAPTTTDTRPIRLTNLSPESARFLSKLHRANYFQPLTFDLSREQDQYIQDVEIKKMRVLGRVVVERIIDELVRGHIERSLQPLLPNEFLASQLYWGVHDARKKGKASLHYSPWDRLDPRFKKFQDILKPFGIEVSLSIKDRFVRELSFKAAPFDPEHKTS